MKPQLWFRGKRIRKQTEPIGIGKHFDNFITTVPTANCFTAICFICSICFTLLSPEYETIRRRQGFFFTYFILAECFKPPILPFVSIWQWKFKEVEENPRFFPLVSTHRQLWHFLYLFRGFRPGKWNKWHWGQFISLTPSADLLTPGVGVMLNHILAGVGLSNP